MNTKEIGRRARRALSALLMGASLAIAVPAGAAESSPSDVVRELNATLLEVMQHAGELGFRGRLEKLAPVLGATFHYPLMARVAVSQHWQKLTPEQQKLLAQRFAELSSATFAARFDGYGGETFEILKVEQRPRDTILVENHLVKPQGDAVPLNYLLRQVDGRWRIVDVYLDAKFSQLAINRSEFTSVISRQGFDALIAEIESRIAKMQREAKI